ncbi:IclR family transcriptional regulator [Agrobacterium larrymoorei]|uniref:IclR family transcriptional regulator n=1 Tax=Agrobacterium larrymoorei TaxID=160699 RepID=UPI001F48AD79|nr:IclR family transcriptional regulator [Agrobacterium larrymoorei]
MRHSQETAGSTGTVGKAVALLEIVVMSSEPLRFTDILQKTGQPRGSLHRQLSHLVEEGLLEQKGDQTYVAGVRLLTFAARAWSSNDLRSVAAPHLKHLHAQTEESVHLGVLRGAEVIYLDKIDGKHAVRMHSQIGRMSPVYCTGIGKAALSLLSDEKLAATVQSIGFQSFTANTITDGEHLMREVSTIRRLGYACDLEEHEIGIQCIAVPVFFDRHDFTAAISVTGPAYRLTRERLENWAPLLRETAAAISSDLELRLPPSAG